jgi:hypothetical protein
MLAALEPHLDSIAEAWWMSDDVRPDITITASERRECPIRKGLVEYRSGRHEQRPAPGSADLIYSNSVLEHVPKQIIRHLDEIRDASTGRPDPP